LLAAIYQMQVFDVKVKRLEWLFIAN